MRLSGMRDGQKKSVTVPEIPGQLGPMITSSISVTRPTFIVVQSFKTFCSMGVAG